MGAVVLDQADLAVGVAKGDQVLAEQTYPQRCPVRFQLLNQDRWKPVRAQRPAHRRPSANAHDPLVQFTTQHARALAMAWSKSYPSQADAYVRDGRKSKLSPWTLPLASAVCGYSETVIEADSSRMMSSIWPYRSRRRLRSGWVPAELINCRYMGVVEPC